MTREVVAVGPATPLKQVAALMLRHRISGLPVVDGGRVVGGTTTTASKATLSTPPAPFRVEVRAPAGTHVTFGYAA